MIGRGADEQVTVDGLQAEGSRWSALAGLVGLIACGIAFFLLIQAIGPERLQHAVTAAGPLAPLVYVLLKAATVVVTPLSGSPFRLAAGVLFGFWEGVALSVLGGVLGGSLNFWIARRFGRAAVARLLGTSTLARVEPTLDRLGTWRKLALARVILAPLWDVLSYGIGLTHLRFRTYLTVAILGDIVPTMILVGLGSSVMEAGVIETGTSSAQAAEAALPLLAVMVGLGVAAAALSIGVAVLRPRLDNLLAGAQPSGTGSAEATCEPRPSLVPGQPPAPSRKGRSAA